MCILMLRIRRILAAMRDLVALYLLVHATAEVLLQLMPTCLKTRHFTRTSNASHSRRTPINSRSLMVIHPSGLSLVVMPATKSGGNSTCQTMNPISTVKPNHTPPQPSLQASLYPRKSGKPLASWRTCVGAECIWRRMIFQSVIHCRRKVSRTMKAGSPCMAR